MHRPALPVRNIIAAAIAAALALVLLGAAPPSASAGIWQPIGPEGGRADGFAQAPSDPDRLYFLARGYGVFRSEDRGESWARVDSGEPVAGPVAVSPADEDLLVMADTYGSTLRRSTDGGASWSEITLEASWSNAQQIAFDPTDPARVLAALGYCSPGPGLYRSTDAGRTWSATTTGFHPTSATSISFHPTESGVVIASGGGTIYRSTDGGSSWSPAAAPALAGGVYLDFCEGAPDRMWALDFDGDFYRSDDGGQSFAASPNDPPLLYGDIPQGIAASPVDPDAMVGAFQRRGLNLTWCVAGTVRTTDAGQTWTMQEEPFHAGVDLGRVRRIVFDTVDPATVYLATSETTRTGLLRSQDGGATWSPWAHGIRHLGIAHVDYDTAGTIYVREGGLNGLWTAPDIGGPWTYGATHPEQWLQRPDAFEVNHRAAGLVHEGGSRQTSFDTWSATYAQSTDGGATWATDTTWPVESVLEQTTVVASNCGDGGAVYAWKETALYRSLDGGPFDELPSEPWVTAAVVDPVDPLRVFTGAEGGLVRLTTDGGESWSLRSDGLPGGGQPRRLFLDPAAPERMGLSYISPVGGAALYRSDDSGEHWSPVALADEPGPFYPGVDWDPVQDRFAIAGSERGVYVTDRGFVNVGLPTLGCVSIRFLPGTTTLLLGTSGYGVFALDLEDPTSAEVAPRRKPVLSLRLRPNPSAGAVRVELAVPEGASGAELAVYSVGGRRVTTLGRELRGTASVVWDGRDAGGAPVARGVYFVRATSGDATVSRKVVLVAP